MLKLIRTKLERVQNLLKLASEALSNSLKFSADQTVSFEKHDRILKQQMNLVLEHQTDLMEIQTKSELHLDKLKELYNKNFDKREKLLSETNLEDETNVLNVKGRLFISGQLQEIQNNISNLKLLINEFEL